MILPPIERPKTGRSAEMTDEEWAAWRAQQLMGNSWAAASCQVTAAEIRDNPAVLDEFRLYAAQFPHYNRHTFANSMRLWAQDPGATRVQGEKWWGGEGRQLREGAVPLWVESLYKGTRREQRENPDTGETEEVTRRRRGAMVGTAVYDVSQTVPKDGVTCILCRTEGPKDCPPTCPVYLPESGRIPSRSDVLIEAATQLKEAGGLDIEEVLSQLGADPYRDGDHVEGTNSFVISVPRPGGKGTKALRVHVSHDDHGRTRYAVIRVGVFWIGPDSLEYDRAAHGGGRRRNALRVQYGDARDGEDYHYRDGSLTRPGAPTINGITLAGDGTYNADDITKDGKSGPWVGRPGRYSSNRVPEKTEQATRRIIFKLTQHWLGQPGLDELRAAHDRHHAPSRKAGHDRRAERLREQVGQLAAELAEQEEAAAAQAALVKAAGEEA
ncbi:hypothetical protein ABT158_22670 [Nonomuraea sp. NPDC001636]|uniref:hypothetical protein n=2 Tax=unclassified Nonomuraea TaxID=2593643 RepID=UPI0033274D89